VAPSLSKDSLSETGEHALPYQLGVDLGTTYTAAAVARDGRVEVATLGTRAAVVPSVLFLREDETLLVGETASRRGVAEPDRVVREFKRRFGDPTPILIAGTPYAADQLMAMMLRWVIDTVAIREGGAPDRVVVTHPANWGPYKLDLLAQAIRLADVGDPVVLTEPEAAVISYAANERVEVGSVVAVYDLGGGTFDAAVLRKTAGGFEIMGRPDGIERLGGIDFDEAVFAHVATVVGSTLENLDPDDTAARTAVARLREDCVDAKEALSSDTHVVIPVLLPPVHSEVRMTRGEFEALIRPSLSGTVDALSRALASAGVLMADVKAVLLVGGSSQIPLVGQLLAERLGCPVAVDAHPKHTVALGAARAAAEPSSSRPPATLPPPAAAPPAATAPVEPSAPPPEVAGPERPSEAAPTGADKSAPGRPFTRLLALGAVAAAVVVVALVLATRGGGNDEPGGASTTNAAIVGLVAPEAIGAFRLDPDTQTFDDTDTFDRNYLGQDDAILNYSGNRFGSATEVEESVAGGLEGLRRVYPAESDVRSVTRGGTEFNCARGVLPPRTSSTTYCEWTAARTVLHIHGPDVPIEDMVALAVEAMEGTSGLGT
jgi:actin-like ATPase involved in cell morphogenesis